MARFKNIKIKKRGGGSRLQRVQVLSSGKYKFVKNKSSARASSNPRPKKKARKVKRKMTKKKTRRSRSMTIPLAPVIGLGVGLTSSPAGYSNGAIGFLMKGQIEYAMRALSMNFLGYEPANGTFRIERLGGGLFPLILGGLVHKFVGGSPLNLNATLGRARVPLIRI